MDDPIQILFEAYDERTPTPKETETMKAAEPILDGMREKLSWEEFDQFWCAVMDIGTADVEASFAKGFRLGARLMLDVLG